MPWVARTTIPGRLAILTWVILWIATVPLFHTHLPDAYGPPSQAGLAHTVFSRDLPGEFSRLPYASHEDHFAQVSNRVSNSPELNFVLSSEDPESRKMGEHSVSGVLCKLRDRMCFSGSVIEWQVPHRSLLLFAGSPGPRAPPSAISGRAI